MVRFATSVRNDSILYDSPTHNGTFNIPGGNRDDFATRSVCERLSPWETENSTLDSTIGCFRIAERVVVGHRLSDLAAPIYASAWFGKANEDGAFTEYNHLRCCERILHDKLLKLVMANGVP